MYGYWVPIKKKSAKRLDKQIIILIVNDYSRENGIRCTTIAKQSYPQLNNNVFNIILI